MTKECKTTTEETFYEGNKKSLSSPKTISNLREAMRYFQPLQVWVNPIADRLLEAIELEKTLRWVPVAERLPELTIPGESEDGDPLLASEDCEIVFAEQVFHAHLSNYANADIKSAVWFTSEEKAIPQKMVQHWRYLGELPSLEATALTTP